MKTQKVKKEPSERASSRMSSSSTKSEGKVRKIPVPSQGRKGAVSKVRKDVSVESVKPQIFDGIKAAFVV
jgi:hypothetical protein